SRDGYEASDSSDGAHNFVAGVLDGHGVAGAKVSSFVCAKISSEMKAKSKSSGRISAATVASNLTDAFAAAQKSLLRAHGADCAESGSTCVVCVREGDNLIVANVGDSRCVLGRRSNTKAHSYVAVDLSVDHKPDRPDEASRIARAGGVVEPARGLHGYAGPARVWRRIPRAGGLAVSRAFGDSQLHSAGVVAIPEIKTLGVTPNDAFVVLASDGVWDHVSSAEA
ncbi:predicted protein, partial [Micromonas commoda]